MRDIFTERVKVGTVGPGNTGADLVYRVMKSSNLEMKLMADIVESGEIRRAVGLGFDTSVKGVDAIAADTEIRIVSDVTSAKTHLHNAPMLKKTRKIVMNMTPAAVGPYVVLCVNMSSLLFDTDSFNMVTYGGQAMVPIAHAINRVADSEYTEVVSAISSKSAGPGARVNIDGFTEITSEALGMVAGSDKGKAIIVLNPANPPLMMTNTIYALARNPDEARMKDSVETIVREVKSYVPGYRLRVSLVFDGNKVTVIVEVEGAGDLLPTYSRNLDIINQAAVATAEKVAGRLLGGKR